jgi:hypothetical protein
VERGSRPELHLTFYQRGAREFTPKAPNSWGLSIRDAVDHPVSARALEGQLLETLL